jgi:ABC-type transporter Mla maintaining outer membrane lipid asymmetry ATPase subunit MlaF
MTAPVIEVTAVSKQYGALRPLRIEQFSLSEGDHVALLGLDQPAAEVLINLLTGATLPDSGQVRVFGRATAEIADSTDWLLTLDRFGIVSERAALLDAMTVVQNLAMPFSLQLEPPHPEVARQAADLAEEVGLPADSFDRRVGELDTPSRMRVRLARALALDPSILLLEHPSATLPRHDVARYARDVRAIAVKRRAAALSITADVEFATAASARTLVLEPATGRLRRR